MSKRMILAIPLLLALANMVWGGAPTTLDDFFLPGSQPLQSGNIEHPDKCDNCHGGYDLAVEPAFNWRGSMMAQAARDPLFYACLAIANQDAPDVGDLCLRCHTPDGWLGGRSVPTDGSILNNNDREGVQCDFCHKLVRPTPLGVNPYPDDADYTAGTYAADQAYLSTLSHIPPASANGMYVADQNNAKRGPFVDAAARHQMFYSPYHKEAGLCGTCHDVSNPAFSKDADGNYRPNEFGSPAPSFAPYDLFPIERTYSEWLMSEYNTPTGVLAPQFGGNKQYVSTCQDCHMRDVTGVGCNKRGAPLRNDLPLHDMTGGNTFIPLLVAQLYPDEVNVAALDAGIQRAMNMLQLAASLSINVVKQPSSEYLATVRVTNETGHKLPSGYPEGRRIWLNVKVYDAASTLLHESGEYNFATAELIHDDEIKVYEVKPGISEELSTTLGLPAGPSFHFVLNHEIFSDNRIPPRGFTNANFAAIGSPPVNYTYGEGQYWDDTEYWIPAGASTIVVTLYYQTTTKEYVEFLRDENNTNDWGNVLYDLWNTNGKSAPVVMNSITYEVPAEVPPVADFSATPTSGSVPLDVAFTDLSTNNPTAWSWEFGDGAGSSAQNPVHTYTAPGSYTVRLTAFNDFGEDTREKAGYVTVLAGAVMHVDDIVVTREVVKNRVQGVATVRVVDSGNSPVPGATVSGTFTGPTSETATGDTDANGEAVVASRAVRSPLGNWCFEVTNVGLAGATYDPAANVVTQACEGGFAIQSQLAKGVSKGFGILGSRPNPFNPVTEIRFVLPSEGRVILEIFNVRGQRVATLLDGHRAAGEHSVIWNNQGVPSGRYTCVLQSGNREDTRSLTILK